jgi:hypothetical protein
MGTFARWEGSKVPKAAASVTCFGSKVQQAVTNVLKLVILMLEKYNE